MDQKLMSHPPPLGPTSSNGQITNSATAKTTIQNTSCPKTNAATQKPNAEATKPVVIRRSSLNATVPGVDPLAPRRLSQLFVPPNEEELGAENEETTRLLGEATSKECSDPPTSSIRIVPRKNSDTEEKKPLGSIEKGKTDSDLESSGSSKQSLSSDSSDASGEDEEDDNRDLTSWEDTICSNRSAYFKHYYLGSKTADEAKSRTSTHGSTINSLASLITERRKSVMDIKQKKKPREDLGLMLLVIGLFLLLVIGISLIHYFYYQHLLELSLFKRLKYNEEERLLELFDWKGELDIVTKMGTTFFQYSKPEECTKYLKYLYEYTEHEADHSVLLDDITLNASDFKQNARTNEFQFDNETVCLEWAHKARVQIHHAQSDKSVNCYNVFWLAHEVGMDLQDCILLANNKAGVWWGIGEVTEGGYPLESIHHLTSTHFITSQLGTDPWGKILRRVFLSSNGGLLTLPAHLTTSISINDGNLCIANNASDQLNSGIPLTLNYTICSSPNISSSLLYLDYLRTGQSPQEQESKTRQQQSKERILQRIEHPVWIPYMEANQPELTQEGILRYVDRIMAINQSHWGHILLPETWQAKVGQLLFDPERFPDPKNLTDILIRKGFNLALTISPVVSTDTTAFTNGTTEGYWVQQKGLTSLPILVQVDNVVAGAITDFTNPRASDWYVSKLKELKRAYGIDRFYLAPPDSSSVSIYHKFNQPITNPDLYLEYFLKAVSQISPPLSTESAIVPPPLPTFVTVGSLDSGWESLSTLIPRILSLTMLGYPLVDAGIVGGTPGRPGNMPDDELFIRWCQAACFLPAFQIHAIPDFYSEETKKIVFHFLQKRRTMVLPRLKQILENTLQNRTPLISPLGLLYSNDIHAAAISDEWIIGTDLLVAPVLHKDKTSRNIYIPEGLWESQSDGRLKRGPGWIYNHHVPLTEVAHFIKRHSVNLSG